MNSDLKPIIEQIKSKINGADMEQLKKQVSWGVQVGQTLVKSKAKELLEQSKKSKVVNEVVVPWLESDQANKAIEAMNDTLKLKDTPLMNKILKLRQDLIDSKVSEAREANETTEPVTTATTTENDNAAPEAAESPADPNQAPN